MRKLILVLCTLVLAVTAGANTIVFDTFGAGNIYDQGNGYAVGFIGFSEAAQFTALASGNLATVDLGLTYDNPGPVDVFLYGDAAGSPDNANQMFLGSGTPTAQFGSTNNSVVSLNVGGIVPVTMGSIYWLVLKPTNPNEFDVWNFSTTTVGQRDFSTDGTTWNSGGNTGMLPAFRLTTAMANGVPDSGSAFVMMLGSVAALFAFRRTSKLAA